MELKSEFNFTLPKGYVDRDGRVHRSGTMRLATARDEIEPLRDPRVEHNEAYLSVILLSRVITRLGDLADVHTGIVENMFARDVAYLQAMYERINFEDDLSEEVDRPLDEVLASASDGDARPRPRSRIEEGSSRYATNGS